MWLVYTYFEFFNDSQFRYDAYSLNEHLKARENMLLFSGSMIITTGCILDFYNPRNTGIYKGAHRERNQPVPVWGFKPFCYRALNICSKIRGGAKNNQCHGTVALARWAPLMILDCSFEKNYFRLNPGNRKSDFRHPICHCVLLLYKSKYPTKKAS